MRVAHFLASPSGRRTNHCERSFLNRNSKMSGKIVYGGLACLLFIAIALGLLWFSRETSLRPKKASGAAQDSLLANRSGLTTRDETSSLPSSTASSSFSQLYALLAKKSPDEIEALARQLAEPASGDATHEKLRLFFQVWTALDAKTAFKIAATFPNRQTQDTAMEAIVQFVASNDAASVAQMMIQLPQGSIPALPSFLGQIIVRWSDGDPAAAAEFLGSNGAAIANDGHGGMGQAATTWNRVSENFGAADPEAAMSWAASIADRRRASVALQGALVGWSQKDPQAVMDYVAAHASLVDIQQATTVLASDLASRAPEAAIKWLNQLPQAVRWRALSGIASTLASNDPAAAIQWAQTLSPNDQQSATELIISRGALKDPQTVANWINTMAGSTRDNALASFASAVTPQDPATAASWVETIENPSIRRWSAWGLVDQWMRSDPEAAQAWIQNSSLTDDEKRFLLNLPKR